MTPTQAQDLRKHFDLKPCKNKTHAFKVGNLLCEWVWAEDYWASLVDDMLRTYHLSFHTIKAVDETVAHSVVVWKLKIIWGFLK